MRVVGWAVSLSPLAALLVPKSQIVPWPQDLFHMVSCRLSIPKMLSMLNTWGETDTRVPRNRLAQMNHNLLVWLDLRYNRSDLTASGVLCLEVDIL